MFHAKTAFWCLLAGAALWPVLAAAGEGDGDQAKAEEAIKKLGGIVKHDDKAPEKSLTGIFFIKTKLDEAKLKELLPLLAKLPTLKELNLYRAPVDDAAAKELAKIKGLHGLYLNETPIGDDGLKHLANLSKLRKLYLGGTAVTDEGLKNLAKLKDLQVLYVGYNKGVTAAGVAALQKELPKCKILTQ